MYNIGSFARASTTSLGSVCFGSLIVAVLEAVKVGPSLRVYMYVERNSSQAVCVDSNPPLNLNPPPIPPTYQPTDPCRPSPGVGGQRRQVPGGLPRHLPGQLDAVPQPLGVHVHWHLWSFVYGGGVQGGWGCFGGGWLVTSTSDTQHPDPYAHHQPPTIDIHIPQLPQNRCTTSSSAGGSRRSLTTTSSAASSSSVRAKT